jgi:ditrans,polycis-polyprenyl diphosphate synthase
MLLDSKNVTANMLERHIYTAQDPPLDMLIRTSGVSRLSDFMLWQCHQDTRVFFLKCLWPDFGVQDVLSVLLEWQRLEMQNRR